MKAHQYWSVGALITMIGTFYTGHKGLILCVKLYAMYENGDIYRT